MSDSNHTSLFSRTGLQGGRYAPNLFNPPNKHVLHWRLATSSVFFREMKERLKYTNKDGDLLPTPTGPMIDLVRNPTTDWAAALMESWSVIGDILCFYQERLLNEGFIGTAAEPKSVTYLTATLGGNLGPVPENNFSGHFRFPGTAGSAEIILSVRDGDAMPGSLLLEKNKVIRRVTPKGGHPIDFVVKQDTEINSAWNILVPNTGQQSQQAQRLPCPEALAGQIFMGTQLNLKPQAFVFCKKEKDGRSTRKILQIDSVRNSPADKQSTVTWHSVSSLEKTSPTKRDTSIETAPRYLTTRTFLPFGAHAPDFSQQPLMTQMQHIANGGVEIWQYAEDSRSEEALITALKNLPATKVQDILVTRDGTLYLATKTGIYFYTSEEGTWRDNNQGLTKRNVQTLIEDESGIIYAGTVNGGVFRSLGSGASWSSLPGGYVIKTSLLGKKLSQRTSLPATTVNKLALGSVAITLKQDKRENAKALDGLVIAATDNGIFSNTQKGQGWFNIPLKSANAKQNPPSGSQPQSATPILDAVLIAHRKKVFILCASKTALLILYLPEKTNTSQAKNNSQKTETNSQARGRSTLPNIFMVLFDGLAKIGQFSFAPFVYSASKIWEIIKSTPGKIKEFVEWIADVDPLHWAETGLPYPGSKIPFEGDLVNLALFSIDDHLCLALSTTKGIYRYNPKSSDLSPMMSGLPDLDHSAPELSVVPDPALFGGASLVLLLKNKIYGLMKSGDWHCLLSLPVPALNPSKIPDYPEKAIPFSSSKFCILSPLTFHTDWPDFEFVKPGKPLTRLDVTGLRHPVKSGTEGALFDKDGKNCLFFRVLSSSQKIEKAFGLKSPVIRLEIQSTDASIDPQPFHRRTTKILLEQKELFTELPPATDAKALRGSRIDIEGNIPDLTSRKISISGPPVRVLPVPIGGLRSGTFKNNIFNSDKDIALPLYDIQKLVPLKNGQILALTENGLWQGTLKGPWNSANEGLPPDDIHALHTYPMGEQGNYLLTASNLYSRKSASEHWSSYSTPATGASLLCFLEQTTEKDEANSSIKFLGTNGKGLFFQKAEGAGWAHVNWTALDPDGQIAALQEMSDGSIFVSSVGQGLFHVNASLTDWKQVNLPPSLSHISILRTFENTLYLSNNTGSLYRLEEDKGTYILHPVFATRNRVPILDISFQGQEILIGLDGSGLVRSTDNGQNWTYHSTGLCGSVTSLLYYENYWLLAIRSHDPSLSLKPVYLSSISAKRFAPELDQALLSDFLISALKQAHIKLPNSPLLHLLQEGRSWLMLSRPTSNDKVQENSLAYLFLKDTQKIKIYLLGDSFPVLRYIESKTEAAVQYEIFIHKGLTHTLTAYPDEVFYYPAHKTDPNVKQVLSVQKSLLQTENSQTTLYFKPALKTLFDASQCVINGNLAELTQGQLIENETLGDGNAALSFQSFTLKAGQLVFTQQSKNIIAPVLSVTVEGQPYHPISDLLNAGPHEKVYILTLNDKGTATLTFGDGINGSRLPSGVGNVKATYRINMPGFDASDEKAQFIITEPPYGLTTIASAAAQNPVKISEKIKKGDKVSLNPALLPKRLVTLSDFETVSASFSSVAKSKIRTAIIKRQKGLILTLAGSHPKALEQKISLLKHVKERITHLSLTPNIPLQIVPAVEKPFCLSAILTIQNGLSSAQKAEIAQKAYQSLKEKYGYEAASIGSAISQHQVQSLLIQGLFVKNAGLTGLYFENLPPTPNNLLASNPPDNRDVGEDLIYLSNEKHAVQITLIEASNRISDTFSFPTEKDDEVEEVCLS